MPQGLRGFLPKVGWLHFPITQCQQHWTRKKPFLYRVNWDWLEWSFSLKAEMYSKLNMYFCLKQEKGAWERIICRDSGFEFHSLQKTIYLSVPLEELPEFCEGHGSGETKTVDRCADMILADFWGGFRCPLLKLYCRFGAKCSKICFFWRLVKWVGCFWKVVSNNQPHFCWELLGEKGHRSPTWIASHMNRFDDETTPPSRVIHGWNSGISHLKKFGDSQLRWRRIYIRLTSWYGKYIYM